MNSWTWAAASCKGLSHLKTGTRKQDAQITRLFGLNNQTLASVVSDGAGTAKMGGQGASLICRSFAKFVANQQSNNSELPTPDNVIEWTNTTREIIAECATKRGLTPRDFAATLLFVVTNGSDSLFVHIGDGGFSIRDSVTKHWLCPTWPNQGEYASTTYFLTDTKFPPARICSLELKIDALAVFSDGIERLALDFSTQEAHQPFFNSMIKPLESTIAPGKNKNLCLGLSQFLNSDKVNQRTDDDKTLVLAIRK